MTKIKKHIINNGNMNNDIFNNNNFVLTTDSNDTWNINCASTSLDWYGGPSINIIPLHSKLSLLPTPVIIKNKTRTKNNLEIVEISGKPLNFLRDGIIYTKTPIEEFTIPVYNITCHTYIVKHNEILFYFDNDNKELLSILGKNFDSQSLSRLIELLLSFEADCTNFLIPSAYKNNKKYMEKISTIESLYSTIFD